MAATGATTPTAIATTGVFFSSGAGVELGDAVGDVDESEAVGEAEEGLDPGDADDDEGDGVVDADDIVLVTIVVLVEGESKTYQLRRANG